MQQTNQFSDGCTTLNEKKKLVNRDRNLTVFGEEAIVLASLQKKLWEYIKF